MILFSRDVADSTTDIQIHRVSPVNNASVTTTFESASTHIMALNRPPAIDVPLASFPASKASSIEDMEPRSSSDSCKELPELSSASSMEALSLHGDSDHPSVHGSRNCIDSERSKCANEWRQKYREKGKDVDRGRTLQRTPASSNPLVRAESIPGKHEVVIEIAGQRILKRQRQCSNGLEETTCSAGPAHSPLGIGPPLCSQSHGDYSDASYKASTSYGPDPHCPRSDSIGSVPLQRDVALQDRASKAQINTCSPSCPALTSLSETLAHVSPSNSSQEATMLESSRLECSACRMTSLSPSLISPTTACSLPTEIIQQVYLHLSPIDFNSARHVCRSWFITSLERSILEIMLKRGGWFSGSQFDLTANHVMGLGPMVNDEWLMSMRIARECTLTASWKGIGFAGATAFIEQSRVDFTEMSISHSGAETTGSIFTVSGCGKYLMVANGCMVYVYELNKTPEEGDGFRGTSSGSLRAVTSIMCPRRVVACSMDTSSHRYAIALLLDGRMGLVCDIAAENIMPPASVPRAKHSMQCCSKSRSTVVLRLNAHATFLEDVLQNKDDSIQVCSTQIATPILDSRSATDDYHEADLRKLKSKLNKKEQAELPENKSPYIECGPRLLHRNICSDDDPPRSVAICPQRRCVAFGCSAGIELHWVDALTGQDLNRWFPLTAPSDFLFFLPPRKTIDSSKKLRLISSAAKPSERAAAVERAFGGRIRHSPFWERGDPNQSGISTLSRLRSDAHRPSNNREISDHYRAVPLSDGYHILFTDPTTNMLCLGSDAPVGGPTKLLRKIWFQSPAEQGRPLIYAGGSDLAWGVRVVAAFGTQEEQSIWLFSVPADVFVCNQDMHISSTSFFLNDRMRVSTNTDWMDWWPGSELLEWFGWLNDPLPGLFARRVWPLKIEGQQIGSCRGVVDLAIDSGPTMTVWAFSKTGVAKVWKINDGTRDNLKNMVLAGDGTVRNVDKEGDIEMLDRSLSSAATLDTLHTSGHLDGADWTIETDAACSRFDRQDRASCNRSSSIKDAARHLIMDHIIKSKMAGEQRNDRFWAKYGWSEASYRGQIATVREDVVEDLAGIARIDLEIR